MSSTARKLNRLVLLLSAVALVGVAIPASAQDADQPEGFDVQQLNPMPSQFTNHFGVASALVLERGQWEIGLFVHHADDPLVLRGADDERILSIVGSQTVMNLMGSVGIGDIFDIGFDVPLILSQSADSLDDLGTLAGLGSDGGFGLGDIRIVPKFTIVTTHDPEDSPGGVALGFLLNTFIPVGDAANYQGEGFRIEPRIAFDIIHPRGSVFSFNLGYTVREEIEIENMEVGDTFTYGIAATLFINDYFRIVPEIAGEAALGAEELVSEETPLEAILGFKIFPIEEFLIGLGAGTGLVEGFGTPDYRVFLNLAGSVIPPRDTDGDGLYDDVDECIFDPEDFDDFEDEDGCPDIDNDQDTILDVYDTCPNDPEDFDGFEDEEGCPDPDNDQDGILDVNDGCPNDPEDIDGWEDEDGCPDVDNDFDGLLDVEDGCPDDPEDFDDWEDEDGCPDPDNDQDTILDVVDECPNVPELFNGIDDEDGCPEQDCDRIDLGESIYFEYDSDVIQPRSYSLLDNVSRVINSQPDLLLIRIEGHTDSDGSASYNEDLSRRRAASVLRYLIDFGGVDSGRLYSDGYGESYPIASNSNDEGKAQNRRVEFTIIRARARGTCEERDVPLDTRPRRR